MTNKTNNPHYKSVEVSTHGIVFLGTPHLGLHTISLVNALLRLQSVNSNTNEDLMADIDSGSKTIDIQLSQYASISSRYHTKFFYELLPTTFVGGRSEVVRSTGVWCSFLH